MLNLTHRSTVVLSTGVETPIDNPAPIHNQNRTCCHSRFFIREFSITSTAPFLLPSPADCSRPAFCNYLLEPTFTEKLAPPTPESLSRRQSRATHRQRQRRFSTPHWIYSFCAVNTDNCGWKSPLWYSQLHRPRRAGFRHSSIDVLLTLQSNKKSA